MKHLQKPSQPSMVVVVISVLICTGTLLFPHPLTAADARTDKRPSPGGATRNDRTLFTAFVPVLRHPRCMNCHSQGDFPRQGDDGHPHVMNVRRGSDGQGVTAEKCNTCHQDHNLPGAHLPPGASNWGLPPAKMPMIWQGLSDAQICRSIKDPKQNKNRNIDQVVEHLTEDRLVMWGWNPGEGRNPIPMPQEEFVAKVREWRAAGAPCPAD